MPRTTDSIVNALLNRNARVTGPRREIIEYISSVPRTFTAEDVCAKLNHIGRATVYRTLKILQDADIICKIVMPGDEMAYSVSVDLDQSTNIQSHHHHAICTVCSAVRYFNAENIERAINALSRSVAGVIGEIIDHRIEVYDICPRCVATDTA